MKVIEASMAAGLIITSLNEYICKPSKHPFMTQTSTSFDFWVQQSSSQKSNIVLRRVLWQATTYRSLKFTGNCMVCIQSFIRTVSKYHSFWFYRHHLMVHCISLGAMSNPNLGEGTTVTMHRRNGEYMSLRSAKLPESHSALNWQFFIHCDRLCSR